jgi:hypothetical protein
MDKPPTSRIGQLTKVLITFKIWADYLFLAFTTIEHL